MDLKRLRYFVGIVEQGSISRAAQILCIAQPPLIKRLQELEEDVSTMLVALIRGIEFRPHARLLAGADDAAALDIYCRRHPVVHLRRSGALRLELASIKLTDNSKVFGSKLEWLRSTDDKYIRNPAKAASSYRTETRAAKRMPSR